MIETLFAFLGVLAMKNVEFNKKNILLPPVAIVLLAAIGLGCWYIGNQGHGQPPSTTPSTTAAPTTTAPETTVAPTTTAPETTAPETSTPETSVPESTEPETTEPAPTAPPTTVPVESEPATTAPPTTSPTPENPNDIVPTEAPVEAPPVNDVPTETYRQPTIIDNGDGSQTIDFSGSIYEDFLGPIVTVKKTCEHCGKAKEDCHRWLAGSGDHTCPDCGETVPGGVCHFCDEKIGD